MPQTLVEKILARASGDPKVRTGDVIWATPDLTTMPELSYPAYVKRLKDVGITALANPERIVVAIDHETPVHSVAGAERIRLTKTLAREQGVGHLYDAEGITHPLVVEKGLVRPGLFVAGADTHTSGLGAAGALAMAFSMEVAMVMATGRIWLKVPGTIRVTVNGNLPRGVAARDIVLKAMSLIGEDQASYNVIEYVGDAIGALTVPERMTLCGLSVDMGADAGVVPADAVTLRYLANIGISDVETVASDDGADLAGEITIDGTALEPQVSVPPSPTNVRAVRDVGEVRIQHAYIGSCASGNMAELRAAAAILKGRKVHPDVQLLVIPATRQVHEQAMKEGVLADLMEAGAQLAASTCGPCFGGLAQLAPGEVRISTSTRNDPGRMGSTEAQIYLASAMTVAASAIEGRIADPRPFAEGVRA